MRINLYTPLSLYEIARVLKCQPPEIDISVSGISLNSNELQKGDLFVAINGKKADGHEFALQASEKGAAAILCEKECPSNAHLLKVANVVHSLGILASHHCSKHRHKTIAITGSVGKSSTCAFLGSILEKAYKVHRTENNYNNEIGVPLTMLSIKEETEILILEMGMNHRGEIKNLSTIAKPDIAMITNIGSAHIGLLGSKEEVLNAKCEIVFGMKRSGILLVPYEEKSLKKIHPNVKTFSLKNKDADYFFHFISNRRAVIDVCGEGEIAFETDAQEIVNNEVAIRAVALAHNCLIPLQEIEKALPMCHLPQSRQTIIEKNGKKIIDDSYNASPESMEAAFIKLNAMHTKGKKLALLGDMLELGDFSNEMHTQIGELYASFHFSKLFAIGKYGAKLIEGAKKGGMSEEQVLYLDTNNKEEVVAFLKEVFKDGDTLLVKASHALGLNEVVKMLTKEEQ